jgi:hypothetical protein
MKFVVKSTVDKGIHQLSQKQEAVHPRALKAVGLQLLNNVVNGSPGASVVPPIKTGVLRSSGSVFVGSKLAGTSPMIYNGSPATNYSAPDNQITIVFNTAYAARMHEDNWTPGKKSRQDGKDVGNKFLSKHLEGDWQELQRLYANILKKDLFQGGLKE